eukprot:6612242-Alexandrium_andersonii.AAC.1
MRCGRQAGRGVGQHRDRDAGGRSGCHRLWADYGRVAQAGRAAAHGHAGPGRLREARYAGGRGE